MSGSTWQSKDGEHYEPAEPVPYNGIQFLKVRRMCGGGSWQYFFQDPRFYFSWSKLSHWVPRKIPGAVICDAVGIAIAWNGDW